MQGRERAVSPRSLPGLYEVGGVTAVVVGSARVAQQSLRVGQRSQSRARPEPGQRPAREQVGRLVAGRPRRGPQPHLRQEVELTPNGHVVQMVLGLQLVEAARLDCHRDTLARLCSRTQTSGVGTQAHPCTAFQTIRDPVFP